MISAVLWPMATAVLCEGVSGANSRASGPGAKENDPTYTVGSSSFPGVPVGPGVWGARAQRSSTLWDVFYFPVECRFNFKTKESATTRQPSTTLLGAVV